MHTFVIYRSIQLTRWGNLRIICFERLRTWNQIVPMKTKLRRIALKVAFIQEGLMRLSFLQTDEPNYFPELEFWVTFHSIWLKSCQIRTGSCSNALFEHLEQLQVLIWHDLSHSEWKKFLILAQENNFVRLFGEMTNSPALSE